MNKSRNNSFQKIVILFVVVVIVAIISTIGSKTSIEETKKEDIYVKEMTSTERSQIEFEKNREQMFKEFPKGVTHLTVSIGDGKKHFLKVEEWHSIRDKYPEAKILEYFSK